ncbi:MAG TPA: citryl-CoA lyase [Acidimicrobiia bacterium]|nr:citryl-CoA lyase [Acidimicrobiia bacterium]
MTGDDSWLRSGIGRSTPDAITVRGRDLATELMGRVSFSEMAFLLTADRIPAPGETRLFDAALVALADHGLTPSVLAARLTWTGATESLQGSVAAGLLGAGNVFLGVVEDTARFLAAILDGLPADADDETRTGAARRAVDAQIAVGHRIPGLGHPVHKAEDPRTPRLYAIAAEAGIPTPHLDLLHTVAEIAADATGKALPINGAGAAGAAWADLGFPPAIVRGFALLARTAGLVGHLAEEMTDPIGRRLWLDVEHRATYTGGASTGEP